MKKDGFAAAREWLLGEIVSLTDDEQRRVLSRFHEEAEKNLSLDPQAIASGIVEKNVYQPLVD